VTMSRGNGWAALGSSWGSTWNAVLLVLLAAGCGEGPPGHGDGAAAVTGTAMDASTREPVAEVEVVGPGGVRSLSDAAGRFRLDGLSTGDSGEVVGRASDGRLGSVVLLPLAAGEREIVLYLRAAGDGAGTTPHQD
jgi:hypothetical protein